MRSVFLFAAMQASVFAGANEQVVSPEITNFNTWFGHMGSKSLKPENEAFIRNVLQDIGVTEHVEIRKMSELTLRNGFGMYPNAFAHHVPGCSRAIVISEDFFDTLSDKAKMFLIRHEVAHLYYNHVPKRLGSALAHLSSAVAIGIGVYYYARLRLPSDYIAKTTNINDDFLETMRSSNEPFLLGQEAQLIVGGESVTIQSKIKSDCFVTKKHALDLALLSSYGSFLTGMIANIKYGFSQEWQADYKAAENEDCLQGGIELFEKMQAYIDEAALEIPEENNMYVFLKNMGKVKSVFNSHPTFEERKDYLRALIKKRDARIAAAA